MLPELGTLARQFYAKAEPIHAGAFLGAGSVG